MKKMKNYYDENPVIIGIIILWIISMILAYLYPFELSDAIGITVAFVTLGGFVGATQNILKQKKLEFRLKYLNEAFISIQKYSRYNQHIKRNKKYPYGKEVLEDGLNRAFNEVQLFGTEEMISKIDRLSSDILDNKDINLDEILYFLRDQIRLQLEVEKLSKKGRFPWVIIDPEKNKKSPSN